jgi:hypothetical protein
METPVLGLQAPDLTSAQVIVCPRGFETPQPDFGIDVGDPEAVEQAHARIHDRGLHIVYPLTTDRGASGGSSSRVPTVASSTFSRTSPTPSERLSRHARRATRDKPIAGPAAWHATINGSRSRHRHVEPSVPVEDRLPDKIVSPGAAFGRATQRCENRATYR